MTVGLTHSLTMVCIVLSCSCGDPGLCHLLVAFPHWQDHIYKHPRHQNDAVLPVLQHLCPAAVLPECLHQSHPLQPHLTEVPGSSLQAPAALPACEKGSGGNKNVQDLHRDQQWHKTQVNGQLQGCAPAVGFTRHSVQGGTLPTAKSHRSHICQSFGSVSTLCVPKYLDFCQQSKQGP